MSVRVSADADLGFVVSRNCVICFWHAQSQSVYLLTNAINRRKRFITKPAIVFTAATTRCFYNKSRRKKRGATNTNRRGSEPSYSFPTLFRPVNRFIPHVILTKQVALCRSNRMIRATYDNNRTSTKQSKLNLIFV